MLNLCQFVQILNATRFLPGDTFRWKGENVSTAEVEYVISKIINLGDVVVYGVDIPGTEGKAGMAAIFDPDDKVDMTELSDELKTALPAYARPIFIRKLKTSVQTTGTYKFQKNQLRKEAYNLSLIDKDSLFFFDPATKNFQELNQSMYKKISNGQIRLWSFELIGIPFWKVLILHSF